MSSALRPLVAAFAMVLLVSAPAAAAPTTIAEVDVAAEPVVIESALGPGEALRGSFTVSSTKNFGKYEVEVPRGYLLHMWRQGESDATASINYEYGSYQCAAEGPCSQVVEYRVDPIDLDKGGNVRLTVVSKATVPEEFAIGLAFEISGGPTSVVPAGFARSTRYELEVAAGEVSPGIYSWWEVVGVEDSWEVIHVWRTPDPLAPDGYYERHDNVAHSIGRPCTFDRCRGQTVVPYIPPAPATPLSVTGSFIVWSESPIDPEAVRLEVTEGHTVVMSGTLALDAATPDLLVPIEFDRNPVAAIFHLSATGQTSDGTAITDVMLGISPPAEERQWRRRETTLVTNSHGSAGIEASFSSQTAFSGESAIEVSWALAASASPFAGDRHLELVAGTPRRIEFAAGELGDPSRPIPNYTSGSSQPLWMILLVALGPLALWAALAATARRNRATAARGARDRLRESG